MGRQGCGMYGVYCFNMNLLVRQTFSQSVSQSISKNVVMWIIIMLNVAASVNPPISQSCVLFLLPLLQCEMET